MVPPTSEESTSKGVGVSTYKCFVIAKASGTMAKEKRKGDSPEEEEVETNICFFFFYSKI